jgi:hypothetical protein
LTVKVVSVLVDEEELLDSDVSLVSELELSSSVWALELSL